MSFQWIIDNATSMEINRMPIVASTTARDNTVRQVSRGGNVWTFTVRLPDGPRWTDYRQNVSLAEADRLETNTINFTNSGLNWMFDYQGSHANTSGNISVSVPSSGNTVTITSAPTLTSGYHFRAGDIIQLGSVGKCYSVAADVAFNQTVITLNRPLLNESSGTQILRVGDACEWTVQCASFPQMSFIARDQIGWSGPFVFVEYFS